MNHEYRHGMPEGFAMTKPDDVVWSDVISFLRTSHPGICRQWFEEIEPVGVRNGVFEARVHDRIRREYLQRECVEPFTDALQECTGRLMSVQFVGPNVVVEPKVDRAPGSGAATGNGSLKSIEAPGPGLSIVPDYTFENFIQGPENRLAHAASISVAQSPGQSYNPLFIHGGVGLGKTHLLQAIYQSLARGAEDLVMKYVSCDDFIHEFGAAVGAGEMFGFRHRFRDVDVLIIDDIHFLTKRDLTQEEFFHTFNTLYQSNKQIVLSSDAPPSEIPALEDRLVSRFKSGLVVEVGCPSYDTRVQIIKQKATIKGYNVSDEVACYIATHVRSNIRELEGALTSVRSQALADKTDMTLGVAKEALRPMQKDRVRPAVTISRIIEVVTDFYGVKLTDLQSKRRQKSIAHPRQVCMYLARTHTRLSLEEIGGYFGGRDHTTVMHAVKTIKAKKEQDEEFARELTILESLVLGDQGIRAGSNGHADRLPT